MLDGSAENAYENATGNGSHASREALGGGVPKRLGQGPHLETESGIRATEPRDRTIEEGGDLPGSADRAWVSDGDACTRSRDD